MWVSVLTMSNKDTGEDQEAATVRRLSCNLEQAVKRSEIVAEGPSSDSISVVSETKCKGCNFNKASLRGHLSKSGKNCRKLYSEEELDYLAQRAKSIHKEKVAQRSQRISEYCKTPEKERKSDFICKMCDKKFIAKHVLDRHMCEAHSSEQSRIKCTECDMTFSRWHTMADHRRDAHHGYRDNKSHICKICYKVFSQSGSLNRHVRITHGEEKKYICGECPSRYARKEDLERHLQKGRHMIIEGSSSKSLLKADTEKWDEGNSETADERNHNKNPEKEVKNDFTCNICDKKLITKYKLERHVCEAHSQKQNRIQCTECEQTFSRRDSMIAHSKTAHDGDPKSYICEICGKRFTQSGSLNRHIANSHEGEKKYECVECPARFCERKDLEKHIQKGRHYVEREPYKCSYCGETMIFKSIHAWNSHFVKDTTLTWFDKRRGFTQDTCVTKLKIEKEQMEEFEKGSTACVHCNETIPNEYYEHWIEEDLEAPEKSTCVNNMMKRQHMTCWMCKGKLDPKDYIVDYENKLVLSSRDMSGHFNNSRNPSSCTVVLCRSREEYNKKGRQMEEMQERRRGKFNKDFIRTIPQDKKFGHYEYNIIYCNSQVSEQKSNG